MRAQTLPAGSDHAPVLACGAWLKNAACLLRGAEVLWSPIHGDLGDPANCDALDQSVEQLLDSAHGQVQAVAHDLHPDFYSTQLAQRLAARLCVPAVAVQHHHAHIAALMAEYDLREPVIGLALDGVGLGTDGTAWGGELLWVSPSEWCRLGHLQSLPLPGGDVAAREPWRMAAAALHVLDRTGEIGRRYGAVVGEQAARTVAAMLERQLNCPRSSSAGRWFDAAAGALGVSVRQQAEAQAAIALEALAADYLSALSPPECVGTYVVDQDGVLDLRGLLEQLFALADEGQAGQAARGAALFHVALAEALVGWAADAAQGHGLKTVALGGGCFMNGILSASVQAGLAARGLQALLPRAVSCGDAGLALGQAWVAARQPTAALAPQTHLQEEGAPCA
ncbi:carbamoyltransferase HypF (plasmid) [Cupriavidus necator H16]|uniref:Carbamoyltransferase HypF homolog n=2 Tax=Cupriavidus necator (strain ATCC 17699 / DSM 428 / KCTC 22496 / NCIMB 10442 / H16 / Stanier 337) TaxID=381666 RepID=HYPF1_CUPNH|nr:carbamoyltransferase HypF [Cupriavidus necator]P45805.1 PUTATIVE PSEUDOGENE: RecName: Full=Carbamoyltransferase HypF homolog [Cupriavidus necator H16]AAP85770.1 HypF1 [Cupriavidus necator H16]QCC05302.1 carbamoyltransferase HypF [Cupriavidus necator H16]QQB81473.1 carbamoyltransferase HypF [Cupriavidus necator]CAA49731.1 HYPF [Cupriavidus necator H16]